MTVLYILHTTAWDGSAHSLLNMIHAVRGRVKPVVLFPQKCAAYEYYRAEGIACVVVPFLNNIGRAEKERPLKYVLKRARYAVRASVSVFCAWLVLRKKGIDIVHTNSGVTGIGYPLSKMLGARHVVHLREFQDKDFGIAPLTGWRRFFKNLASADARIAITNAVFAHFHLETYKNSFVLFNAVLPRGAAVMRRKEKYFLFCSAFLSETKGADFCLEAFARSGLRADGYALYVVGAAGNAAFQEKLRALVESHGMADSVTFVGAVRDVRPFMERAAAFLMCSKNEGFGRVTAEAMFYGCPVIARNSGGSPEFIAHGKTGFLFDTMQECADRMKEVAHTDTAPMAHRAQAFAMEHFSEETYGTKVLAVYERTQQNRHGNRIT